MAVRGTALRRSGSAASVATASPSVRGYPTIANAVLRPGRREYGPPGRPQGPRLRPGCAPHVQTSDRRSSEGDQVCRADRISSRATHVAGPSTWAETSARRVRRSLEHAAYNHRGASTRTGGTSARCVRRAGMSSTMRIPSIPLCTRLSADRRSAHSRHRTDRFRNETQPMTPRADRSACSRPRSPRDVRSAIGSPAATSSPQPTDGGSRRQPCPSIITLMTTPQASICPHRLPIPARA
jgi:hypothetical protein